MKLTKLKALMIIGSGLYSLAGYGTIDNICLSPVKIESTGKKVTITEASRMACIDQASISFPQVILSAQELYEGDYRVSGFQPDEPIWCRFTPHPKSGASPKFRCHLTDDRYNLKDKSGHIIREAWSVNSDGNLTDSGGNTIESHDGSPLKADKIRIKYSTGKSRHREVFTEVAASRILWFLGFYSDSMYQVQANCLACMSDPFQSRQKEPVPEINHFFPASVERKVPGKEIKTQKHEGWKKEDLERIYKYATKEKQHEIEAYILAMNLFHYHNFISLQNRVTCLKDQWNKETGECYHPVMYIQDLGGSFGSEGLFINPRGDFSAWEGETIFKKKSSCKLRANAGELTYVSEGGRKFLWERLQHLTEDKVRSIFTAAHFDLIDPDLREQIQKESPQLSEQELNRQVIDKWVQTFMKRIREIESARCPSKVDND